MTSKQLSLPPESRWERAIDVLHSLWFFAVIVLTITLGGGAVHGALHESMDTKVALAEGKASYLPGAACVISASSEQTPADIIHFARACAKSHEIYLKENKNEDGG